MASGILTGKYEDGIPLNSRASLKVKYLLSPISILFFLKFLIKKKMKGYSWLKDKVLSEDGRKQQMTVREIQCIAEKLNCTLAQLSIGTIYIFIFILYLSLSLSLLNFIY